jgi:thioredoxin 1
VPAATIELTKDNFASVLESNDIVLVDFWAAWCGPCKMFGPIFESAAGRHGDLVFAKVDTDAEPELAQAFGIMSIPTLMIVREQVNVFSQPGALPEPVLEDLISPVRARDMAEVHVKVATHASHAHEGDAPSS